MHRVLSPMASYDVESTIWQALPRGLLRDNHLMLTAGGVAAWCGKR
jgi:hypothetical protein